MQLSVILIGATALFLIGLRLSAFFSGSETGFYRASFLRLSIEANAGDAVARACDREHTTRFDAAGCILIASEKATWMAGEAIQALGGNGYINEYPAGRLLRDAKLYEIGAGTSEIRRMLIGRELFEATG